MVMYSILWSRFPIEGVPALLSFQIELLVLPCFLPVCFSHHLPQVDFKHILERRKVRIAHSISSGASRNHYSNLLRKYCLSRILEVLEENLQEQSEHYPLLSANGITHASFGSMGYRGAHHLSSCLGLR